MDKVTARVLSLPSPPDVREEAGRLGAEPATLEAFAGAPMVKLSGVAPHAAAALQSMVTPPAGLAMVYRAAGDKPPPYSAAEDRGGDSSQNPGLRTQNSEPHTQHSSVLLAGARPLLLDVASRLESAGPVSEREAGTALRTVLERHARRDLGVTRFADFSLEWGKRTYVMGIINVTPDSFSGDGLGVDVEAAVSQALRFVEQGADILDVGGESTRPGSATVSEEEEIARVLPVIERLAKETAVPISIDSYKPGVVRRALDAGASIVNDIWGLQHDSTLADLAAARDLPLILMHNRRAPASRTELGGHFKQVEYTDLMGEIVDGLRTSVELALQKGVRWENIIIDPGIGFGKTPQHNLVVMRRQEELRSLGLPVLMGTSRKSVIGLTLGVPVDDRVEGTAATVVVSICNGADIVRVHDVKEMARVSRMTDAIVRP